MYSSIGTAVSVTDLSVPRAARLVTTLATVASSGASRMFRKS
jgi:hypothetical protein